MIAEMYVKYFAGKMRVVVYPEKHSIEARVYEDPTKSTCARLENEIRDCKHEVRTYLRKKGISV